MAYSVAELIEHEEGIELQVVKQEEAKKAVYCFPGDRRPSAASAGAHSRRRPNCYCESCALTVTDTFNSSSRPPMRRPRTGAAAS